MTLVKNALISVYNKENLDKLIIYLEKNNYNIYSNGDTLIKILELVINKDIVFSIYNYTKSPEICDQQIQILHPKILAGILGVKNNPLHVDDLDYIGANFFDLIVVNLQPLELYDSSINLDIDDFQEYQSADSSNNFENINNIQEKIFDTMNIDQHTILRSACKNYKSLDILSHPVQYNYYMQGKTNRRQLAKDAFKQIMNYDIIINNWLNDDDNQTIGVVYNKQLTLNSTTNPDTKPSFIYTKNNKSLPFEILNGNSNYINMLDIHYAIHLVIEVKNILNKKCCTCFKDNSPTGVSIINRLSMSEYNFYNSNKMDLSTGASMFLSARNIDPISSFSDIIAYSGKVDKEMALIIKKFVSNGIVAFDYSDDAIEILKTKNKNEYLILKQDKLSQDMEFRDINGISLYQSTNNLTLNKELLKDLTENIQLNMILGFISLKYTQSTSACFVFNNKVIGICCGQQNVLDCIKIAGDKAQIWMMKHNLYINHEKNIILVSDDMFQSIDAIKLASEYNVEYILQPGGSMRDNEILSECIKQKIDMVLTNTKICTH